jgi:hypothetical protein
MLAGVLWRFASCLPSSISTVWSELRSIVGAHVAGYAAQDEEVRQGIDHVDAFQPTRDANGQARAKVTAAEADVKKWMEERKASTDAKIAEWKTKREVAHLKSRADNAETYAAAAAVIALASVDEAEQAALEAWLARKDVESVQTAKAA